MEQCERARIKERFTKPETFARSFPFWAWNEKLDQEEIKCQVRGFHEQGTGGFFMHSREGLETEYMGEEWKACIKTAVDEAKKLGMSAWLYDEDRWPSGTAGGLVTSGGDAFRCKGLTLEVCDQYDKTLWQEKELVAVYGAEVSGDDIFSVKRLGESDVLKEKEVCLVVRLEVSGASQWFNQEAPPDNLNPDCVKRFIAFTHEQYYELCGETFGKIIPGIFTDEPSLADTHTKFPENRSWVPWTYGFDTYFKEKRGYEPLDYIPYFYFHGEYSAKIRHDYWRTISERFSEAYVKTISQWCDDHGIAMTGHFLQEDKLGLSVRVSGGTMPLYEHMHIPGIDMLQEKTEEFVTVKQCASVAHQMGRKLVLSETYGCTGWEFTFEGQRHMGDWQYVLGVNRRCQHLALYSLTGCRKRDYPPCFNYNTTWWKRNHIIEDYFARLGVMLEEGTSMQQILLLHPLSTAWSRLGASPYGNPVRRLERDVPEINKYGDQFNDLIKNMCFHHFDMDLGDESILAKYGKVHAGKLRVGEASYHTWVIPPIDTMLRSTFALLKSFVAAGGKLLVMEPAATMLEGEKSRELMDFWNNPDCRLVKDEKALLQALELADTRTIWVQDEQGKEDTHCLVQQRKTGKDETVFLVNLDTKSSHKVNVKVAGCGNVEQWDALTGEVKAVESRWENGLLSFNVTLEAADSKLFRVFYNTMPTQVPHHAEQALAETREIYVFPEKTNITCSMENTLTLDMCRYRFEDENWSEEMQIWQAQKEVRKRLGMRPIQLNGQEQRYKWVDKPHPGDGSAIELEMNFWVDALLQKEVFLAIEHPEWYDIFCNGQKIEKNVQGYLLDKSIQKVPLSNIHEKENSIVLRLHYTNAMEIEDCYLCGMFGVSTERHICKQPDSLQTGDWTKQGFFHYAGAVCYHYQFDCEISKDKHAYLELKDYDGSCAAVTINEKVIEIPWKTAAKIDVTNYLQKGKNTLAVELLGTPRNLFGPFHLKDIKRDVTNAACFRAEGEAYTEQYNVVPYGLYQPPVLYEA